MISLLALAISLRPAAARFTRDFRVRPRLVGQFSPSFPRPARARLRRGPFDPAFFAHLSMLHPRGRARVSLYALALLAAALPFAGGASCAADDQPADAGRVATAAGTDA